MARKLPKGRPNKDGTEDYWDETVVTVPKRIKEFDRVRVLDSGELLLDFRLLTENDCTDYLHRPNGANRAYTNLRQFQARIDAYFESCNGPLRDRNGSVIRDANGDAIIGQVKPYTISGLARAIGMSTATLKTYKRGRNDELGFFNLPEYSDAILSARHKVEEYAETRAYDKDGSYGAKFVLDAGFGWHTTKEAADIKKDKILTKLKQLEFELKKSLIEAGEDDSDITINIVRGKKNE